MKRSLVCTLLILGCSGGHETAPRPDPEASVPATVVIDPPAGPLDAIGATIGLSATVRDQDGAVMAGAALSWSSTSPTVATVDVQGTVTAVSAGSATITASSGTARGTLLVVVEQVAATLTLDPPTDTLASDGGAVRLRATVFDRLGTPVPGPLVIDWSTSRPEVASVDAGGFVASISPGQTEIIATLDRTVGRARIVVVSGQARMLDGVGGGTLKTETGISLDVPEGALTGPQEVSIVELDIATIAPGSGGIAVQLEAGADQSFGEVVTLSFPQTSGLVAQYLPELGIITPVAQGLGDSGNVEAYLGHFSVYLFLPVNGLPRDRHYTIKPSLGISALADVQRALASWAPYVRKLGITFEIDPNAALPNIEIGFSSNIPFSALPWFDPIGMAGQDPLVLRDGVPLRVILLDAEASWITGEKYGEAREDGNALIEAHLLEHVLQHELGHLLGLQHPGGLACLFPTSSSQCRQPPIMGATGGFGLLPLAIQPEDLAALENEYQTLSLGEPAHTLEPVGWPTQVLVAPGGNSPVAPTARAVDRFGEPVEGVTVFFWAEENGGMVQRHAVSTGADGVASSGMWNVGSEGTSTFSTVLASARGVPSGQLRFEAEIRQQATLTVTQSGAGSVFSVPAGIVSDGVGQVSASFQLGTDVTLTAEPDEGWTFLGWAEPCLVSGQSCTVSMDQDRAILATFAQQQRTWADYYPLHVGSRWTYESVVGDQQIVVRTDVIQRTMMFDGLEWFVACGDVDPESGWGFYSDDDGECFLHRITEDGAAEVWWSTDGTRERGFWLKGPVAAGATFVAFDVPELWLRVEATVAEFLPTLAIGSTVFEDLVRVTYTVWEDNDPPVDLDIYFAKGIGMVLAIIPEADGQLGRLIDWGHPG